MANVTVGRPWDVLGSRIAGHSGFQRVERDHLRSSVDELLIVADVVRMVVGIEHIFDRQVRDGFDFLHHPVVVLVTLILGVDDDQSIRGHADQRVGAAARDHIEVRLQQTDLFDRRSSLSAAFSSPPGGPCAETIIVATSAAVSVFIFHMRISVLQFTF